jgi:hypothetical protein
MPGYELLMTLIEFTELSLDETLTTFILSYNKDKNAPINIEEKVKLEKEKLYKAVNKNLYETNPKYKDLFDSKVKDKIDAFIIESQSQYYKDSFISIVAMLSIVIMAMFPQILFKQIIPTCVKFLSYMGYSASPDAPKTLPKYFACLLKSIIYPSDNRLKALLEIPQNELEALINKEMEEILKSRYDLKTRIEFNAKIHNQEEVSVFDISKYQTFANFKPFLQIHKDDITISSTLSPPTKRALSIIKNMNEKIKSSKILAFNIFNSPLLLNSCCLEHLNDNFNYYNYFEEVLKSANKNNKKPNKQFSQSFVLKQLEFVQPVDILSLLDMPIPSSMNISVQDKTRDVSTTVFENHGFLKDLIPNLHDDEWWNNDFYPSLYSIFSNLKDYLKKMDDTFSKEDISCIENKIIKMADVNNITDTLNVLHDFVKTYIPLTVNKLIDEYKVKDNKKSTSPQVEMFLNILQSASTNNDFRNLKPLYKQVLKEYKNHIDSLSLPNTGNKNIKKLSILSYVLIDFFSNICLAPINNKLGETTINITSQMSLFNFSQYKHSTKSCLQLSANIVTYLISILCTKLQRNDNNIESLKSEIEILREKRKQDLMNAYKSDDEERALQMQLKKIGLTDWTEVGTTLIEYGDEGITPPTNTHIITEEDQELNMMNNVGENVEDETYDGEYALVYDDVS